MLCVLAAGVVHVHVDVPALVTNGLVNSKSGSESESTWMKLLESVKQMILVITVNVNINYTYSIVCI